MKLATLIAGLGVALALAVPAAAGQPGDKYGSFRCHDPMEYFINCVAKFQPVPLAEFYRGATPDQLLEWNERLAELLEDTDGDGVGDTVPAFTHVQVQAPQQLPAADDPGPFARAQEICATEGPHSCGNVGYERTLGEFLAQMDLSYGQFARWNGIEAELSLGVQLPTGIQLVVWHPSDA